MKYTVNLVWDAEAAVWIATSEDISGIVMEGDSVDALIERIKIAVPELLELNDQAPCKTIDFHVVRQEALSVFEERT